MQKNKEDFTSIQVSQRVINKLNKMKLCKRESFNSVLRRWLDEEKRAENDLIDELSEREENNG